MNFEKVRTIIADVFGISEDEIKLETNLGEDLGADSLDAVEVIMGIEDEYDIKIGDDDAKKIKTVKDIVDYLDNLKK